MGSRLLIVLDTHAWIWTVSNPEILSPRAQQAIESSTELGVSVISCWELSMLVAKKRITLDRSPLEWIGQALRMPGFRLLPLSVEISVRAGSISERMHGDPADRMIVATTLETQSRLVSADSRIKDSGLVDVIW